MDIVWAIIILGDVIMISSIVVFFFKNRKARETAKKHEEVMQRHNLEMEKLNFFSVQTGIPIASLDGLSDNFIVNEVYLTLRYLIPDGKIAKNCDFREIKGLISSGLLGSFILEAYYYVYASRSYPVPRESENAMSKTVAGIGRHPNGIAWKNFGLATLLDHNGEKIEPPARDLEEKDPIKNALATEEEEILGLLYFINEFSSVSDLRYKQLIEALKDKEICAGRDVKMILNTIPEVTRTEINDLRDAVRGKSVTQ